MNLLKETRDVLRKNGKTLKDIVVVQGSAFGMTVEKFIELADTEYDNGYGAPQVAQDLIVIGNGWWLERHDYDGSEWWEYKSIPNALPINENVNALTISQSDNKDISCGWENLENINIRG